jgi:putative sigma-54 modulation protein
MLEEKINIKYVGMESSDSLKEYILEKIQKKEALLKDATSIEIFFKNNRHSKGVQDDFRLDINVNLPNSPVRVEQEGSDMYANIDLAMDILDRRLKRYSDRKEHWEGIKPWKILEAEAALEALTEEVEQGVDDYSDYVSGIVKRKIIKDMDPIPEAEAIEKMELSGYDQYLFKNKSTGKISMIYRRNYGGYGLVEPE